MDHVAVRVAKDLYLYVTRAFDCFFEVERRVAKSGSSFGLGSFKCRTQFAAVRDEPHAFTTAARRRFQHDGIAKLLALSRLLRQMKRAVQLFPERSARRLQPPRDAHSSSIP